METKLIEGDLLTSGADYICHQVNCMGKMGSGVAKSIREKWPNVYEEYVKVCNSENNGGYQSIFGAYQKCEIENGRHVLNIFGQYLYGTDKKYTNYEALDNALKCIAKDLGKEKKTFAFPYKMGSDRGGGDWPVVKALIECAFEKTDCTIVYYKYNQ